MAWRKNHINSTFFLQINNSWSVIKYIYIFLIFFFWRHQRNIVVGRKTLFLSRDFWGHFHRSDHILNGMRTNILLVSHLFFLSIIIPSWSTEGPDLLLLLVPVSTCSVSPIYCTLCLASREPWFCVVSPCTIVFLEYLDMIHQHMLVWIQFHYHHHHPTNFYQLSDQFYQKSHAHLFQYIMFFC